MCGAAMKMRGSRAELLKTLKANGFACDGPSHTGLDEYVTLLTQSRFSWSPPGHGTGRGALLPSPFLALPFLCRLCPPPLPLLHR